MPFKKHTPEEIIGKLREAEIVLAQNSADAALRDRQFLADMIDTAPPSRGAQ